MRKITKTYFKDFKKSFLFWQNKFGLTQYDILFHHDPLERKVFAEISIKEMVKNADVFLNTEYDELLNVAILTPEELGKHECIHLLLNRLGWLGKSRCITDTDIDEEDEALVNRLMKVL